MAYQNGGTILPLKRTLGGGNIVFEGGQRILDDGDTISTLREIVVDAPPARTIGESTVNEDYVLQAWLAGMVYAAFAGTAVDIAAMAAAVANMVLVVMTFSSC